MNASGAVFSPDGRSVAFHSGQELVLKRVAVSGGAPATVCPVDLLLGRMTWDSSGIVFGQGPNGILRCSANGGMPERLASLQEGELAVFPQLLLDGAALLFSVAKDSGPAGRDLSQVVVQDVATGTRKTIIDGAFDARYVPTGHLVYVMGGVLFAVPFDAAAQAVTGEAVPVVEGVRPRQFAISDTGTLVYVPGVAGATRTDYALGMADRAGTLTRLTVRPGPYEHVRVSRDGNTLAVDTDDGREAIVWMYEVAGKSAMRRLTFGGRNRYPIWSPDGRRVAFQSDREGDLGLFAQNADGTGAVERLTTAQQGEAHVPESWSPDGKSILFSLGKGDRFSLQLLSLTDRKIEPFGGVESFDPIGAVFSPDGRWVAYASADVRFGAVSANRGVFVQPFPATGARYQVPKQQQSLDFHPIWSPQGTELLYVARANSGQMAAVSVSTQPTFGFGNPVSFPATVTAGRGATQQMRAHDVLPDGRLIGLVPATESNASGSDNEMRVVINWFEELKARVPARR